MDAVVVNATFTVSALGALVQLEFGEHVADEVIDRVRKAWSGAAVLAEDAAIDVPAADIHLDVGEIGDVDRFLEQLSMRVTLAALGHNSGRLMMLHAAGIALDDGRVIAFVGPSGRGKTTLSRTLAHTYGYVSDETVAFDLELGVRPYRKPLSVVRKDAPKDQVSPTDAGLRELPDAALTLAAIVFLDRDPTVVEPVIEHLHFADAAPLLVEQSSYLVELEGTIAALAELCDRVGGVRRLRYSEAAALPAVIDSLLAEGPPPAPWTRRQLATTDAAGQPTSADVVDYGDRAVVQAERTLRVLDGIAPTVLRAVGESAEFADILRAVIDAHGTPPEGDAASTLGKVLAELVAVRLLPAEVMPVPLAPRAPRPRGQGASLRRSARRPPPTGDTDR